MVDQQQRPDLPQDLMALPGRPLGSQGPYLDLMQQCWATDPAQRPSFERVISALRCLSRPCGSCAVKQSAKAGTHFAVHEKLASWHLPVQSLHTSRNLFPEGQICSDVRVGVKCAENCCAVQEYHRGGDAPCQCAWQARAVAGECSVRAEPLFCTQAEVPLNQHSCPPCPPVGSFPHGRVAR